MRSGIRESVSVYVFSKLELGQVINRSSRVDNLQALLNLARIEQIAKVDFDRALAPTQQDVVPLRRLNHRTEFLDASSTHRGARARRWA